MILENNIFVEAILPGATVRKLTDEDVCLQSSLYNPRVATAHPAIPE
jgi:hypothetical protein